MTGKHKSEDYKITAVKYYLKHGDLRETCKIFGCAKSSLQRWARQYNDTGKVSRQPSRRTSYKVTDEMVSLVLSVVKKKSDKP